MKIEKVNDNQIRCMLTKEDLADRHIKLSELAYGSEKAKKLFRDMIEQANYEFGFEADDIPLMIEAIPLSGDNIILQITKVEYPEELDTRFSKFSAEKEGDKVEEESSMFSNLQGADDILGLFQQMQEEQTEESEQILESEDEGEENKEKEQIRMTDSKKKEIPVNLTKMYEFQSLDELERLAGILGGYYMGKNDLYKDIKRNKYCLFVRKSNHTPEEFNKVCNIISEYASYRKYTASTEAYLKEHGKLIIKDCALEVMQKITK